MGKPLSEYKKGKIREDILSLKYTTRQLAEKHDVTMNAVNIIFLTLKLKHKYLEEASGVYGKLSKSEAYYPIDYCDELQAWELPAYNVSDLKGWEKETYRKLINQF